MKLKTIIADPLILDQAGIVTMRQAAIFIHIGRCGLVGTTIPQIFEALRLRGGTVTNIVNHLLDLRVVTDTGRATGQGRAKNYVCTVRGWNLLTQPADFSMFPHSQLALENHARKKSRKTTPPENQTPAADAAGIDVGAGGDDDHPADPGDRTASERKAGELEVETQGNEGREGTSETDDAEPAPRA